MSFSRIYERAAKRKGGEKTLKKLLRDSLKDTSYGSGLLSKKALSSIPDDRFLSAMTRSIFQAGFSWKVINNKWDGFEQSFWKFNINRCARMSPEDHEKLLKDTRIVRNGQKIMTVPENARMILDAQREYGSFAEMLAQWPATDFIGLLDHLKKHGSRLGGNTGQYFLRYMGCDSFVLGRDGVAALIHAGVIDKAPTSKSAMKAVQNAYNGWMDETSYGLTEISKILAFSIDT